MNNGTLKTLAIAVVVLLGVWFLLDSSDDSGSAINERFLPNLKTGINDVDQISVRSNDEQFTVRRDGERWTIAERDGYAADVGILREILIALADAKVLETKTSNPDNYPVLGVGDPSATGSTAIELRISGGEIDESVLIGNVAQTSYRYARRSDTEQSVMIDQNPELPAAAGSWLASDILSIPADRVRSISIVHDDGEEIRITQSDIDAGSFEVLNIPEGRELSYPTVANGIGGALTDVTLNDVRAKTDAEAVTVATFDTADGASITATSFVIDGQNWVGFSSSDESISAQISGWLFSIPEYKANLLQRRFDDILTPLEGDE